MTMPDKKEEKPDYYGHRARLRERFMVDEGASMPDYELLELLLMMAIPRRDVKSLAKKLLSKFENLQTILHMPEHKLMATADLPPNTIVLLRLFHTCMLRTSYNEFALSDQPVVFNWKHFQDYCWNNLAYKQIEEIWVYFFDESLHLKAEKIVATGTINRAIMPLNEILRQMVEFNASKFVLVHNHPSGTPKPSDFDKAVTQHIEEACRITLTEFYDHLIVAQQGIYSFRAHGLITPLEHSEDATGEYDRKIKKKKEEEEENKKQKAKNNEL